MVEPSTIFLAYSLYTVSEDVVRHGKGIIRFGRVAIIKILSSFLVQPTPIDYERVENDEEYFEQLIDNLSDVGFDDGIKLLESIIDRTMSDLKELHYNYCDVCYLAMTMDVAGDSTHIMGGVYEEESLWDHIRYEVGRSLFWNESDEYGEYYDENYEQPGSDVYAAGEADWKEDSDDWSPCDGWDAVEPA